MKVGIIGLGFVGSALANGIINAEIIKIDPKLNTNIGDLIEFDPDIVFIAVPTPMHDDGSQDISIVNKIISEIKAHKKDFLLVLKSTVLPSYLNEIKINYENLVLNPEFLKERSADEDFINSKTIIFGGNKQQSQKVSNFYEQYTKCLCKDYIFTDLISASLIKYSINSFLATKVIFFNELQKVFTNANADDSWENFIEAISSDERMGNSHMSVPGPDGRLGFGGPCFPKDTRALLEYSKNIGAEFSLLSSAINVNNTIRSEYNNPTQREKDQNINFNDKGVL
jgi:nucleotide sugar dehydrogenase